MNSVAKLLIRLYQLIISPVLGGRCRFHPSCSAYAYEAFTKLPFCIALKLTIWRVGKCHPWHPGGVDVVPCNDSSPSTGEVRRG